MVGSEYLFSGWPLPFWQQMHERLLGVLFRICFTQLGFGDPCGDPRGGGGQDSPSHRSQGRGEGNLDGLVGDPAEPLLDFRGVPVDTPDSIWAHSTHDFAAQQVWLQRFTGPDVPVAATTTTSLGSTRPAANAGASPSRIVVG